MTRRSRGLALLGLAALLLAAGCGAGVAGVVATSGGSGGGTSAPAIVNLRLSQAKRSPARIEFELQNAGAAVELRYRADPVAAFTPMERLVGLAANPASLPQGPHDFEWDFQAEAGIDSSGRFERDAEIEVSVVGQADGQRAGGGVGNDLPRITSAAADVDPGAGEVSGIVLVEATLEDTPDDRADLRVEFSLDGASWQLARPAQDDSTPEFAFTDVVLAETGSTRVAFFWDTADDLGDADADVLIRFVPFEDVEGTLEQGTMLAGNAFHLDNNAAPIAQLDSGPLRANPDARRGIPIPFRVIDEEGDLVETIFQWRRQGEEFPRLPADNAGLETILRDASQRARNHVCTPYPRFARGRVVPVDGSASAVRLPELGAGEAWMLAAGLAGQTLELLRPSALPRPITPTWSSNPLLSPIAALPLRDGRTAVVLDEPENGRLREIELATGAVVHEITTLGRMPSAMAFELGGEKAVLVASDLAGAWRIDRVELEGGTIRTLADSDGTHLGPVRGIASLGTKKAIFTVDSELLAVDYRDPLAIRVATVLEDLSTPSGVVLDPLEEGRIYLAERDDPAGTGTGRILSIDLDTRQAFPVVVSTESMLRLEHPEALALDRKGSRLLVIASEPGGGRQLLGLDLDGRGNTPFAVGAPIDGEVASLASGPDGLLLIAPSGVNELLVGGGLEQRRVIQDFEPQVSVGEPRQQLAILDAPLTPPARPGQPWRIPYGMRRKASPDGLATTFVWDSNEARGGDVFLRALPRDDEQGTASVGAAPKSLRTSLDGDQLPLGDSSITDGANSVAAADLDGDGDLDLVVANLVGNSLTVFFQVSPGSFVASLPPLGGTGITDAPRSVAAADLDGDDDLDLVAANQVGKNLTVFIQEPRGEFHTIPPRVVGGPGTTNGPVSVAAADINADGDIDLVAANQSGKNLIVFFQQPAGRFDEIPTRQLGNAGITNGPRSVAAADINADGNIDVVAANQSGKNLTIFFQPFDSSAPLQLGNPGTNGSACVTAADLDGDGDTDLVSANEASTIDDLTVFLQERARNFTSFTLGGSLTTHSPRSVAAADLDGDGDLDLASANRNGNTLAVFFQDLPGSFAPAPLTLEPGPAGINAFPVSLAAADLDGDGDQDLVAANEGIDKLTVTFQDSPGRPLEFGEALSVLGPVSVAAADLDGDGDQDLAAARGLNNSAISVFFQEGPGSLPASPEGLDVLANPSSIAAADLDGDGDLDLVAASQSSDNLTVYRQGSQAGSFARLPALGGGITNGPLSAVAADVDGDGSMDIVSANHDGDDLAVFFQQAAGFDVAHTLQLGNSGITNGPVHVAAADLDGDGDLDIVSANKEGNNLTVFFQEAGVLPGTVRAIPAGRTPVAVAAADLDGDGDLDLVSANSDGDNLTVHFLEPKRTFSSPWTLGGSAITNAPVSVVVADLDGDGELDIVSANRDASDLTIFFQESPGRFASSPQILQTSIPRSIAATDLDGDGDQDLVSANGDRLTIFWGGR